MSVQIRLIGPTHEVDRLLAGLGDIAELDRDNMTRTTGEAGRLTAELETHEKDGGLEQDEQDPAVVHVVAS